MTSENEIIQKVRDTVIKAGSTFRDDQKEAFKRAISNEKDERARWILENFLDNAIIAEKRAKPLCDDTGIPHLLLEVGQDQQMDINFLDTIQQGVALGLKELPGRPMAIKGNDMERLDQSGGLAEEPEDVIPAPLIVKKNDRNEIRLHVLLQGGGPEIRGKTYRLFHQHNVSIVVDEIVRWAVEGAGQLGCTPCIAAIGIGRTHFEATALMLEAMVHGDLRAQNNLEVEITRGINSNNIGPLGLGGSTTALGTFLRIGPQRASGVRIVCLRLCCCVEPRVASVVL